MLCYTPNGNNQNPEFELDTVKPRPHSYLRSGKMRGESEMITKVMDPSTFTPFD